jgi:EAL domain-containing protein (putative c-di-GMP-specific phosphodiesterase class I)
MRLLLVDDEDVLRTAYAEVLRDFGFEVDTAGTATEALAQLRPNRYDVILSDIQMPGMTGIEFLKAVRQTDLDVPVVLMTGSASLETAIEAMEYGAFRYLRKPVSRAALEETLQRAAMYHSLARLKRDAIALAGGAADWPSDRAALEGRFEAALQSLWLAAQPIVSWRDRRVYAYEGLMRSDEPALSHPGALLDAAEQLDRLPDLSRTVRRKAVDLLARVPPDILVFMNLHPADLNDRELLAPGTPLARASSRFVFEITERASLHTVDALPRRLDELRKLGFMLAVDDLGAGYAGLSSMAQLEPEYVKIDMSLIRGIHEHATKRKLVGSLIQLCGELGKKVVVEGVEEPAERATLIDLGADLLQGYLFARPEREPPAIDWSRV